MENIKYVIRKDGDCERPAVLWAWADTIKPEDLVYQMHEFKKMGIEEVYAEPVWSLDVDDYLSDFFASKIPPFRRSNGLAGCNRAVRILFPLASCPCVRL